MESSTKADQAGIVHHSFTHTINGRPVESVAMIDVINPATGTPFAKCPDATKGQLNRAVKAAQKAFPTWSKKTFAQRRTVLHKLAAAVREHADELAELITREQGKPFSLAQHEIAGTAHSLEAMANIELKDEVLRDDGKNRISIHYRPLGVVGAIAPWNFPLVLASHKIAQALYAGNTMVLKPSPYTPLSTLLLGEISRKILPRGVMNIVAGGNKLGEWMTKHPDISRISFTGSVATGKRVAESAAKTLKRVTLELGGNDPAIVLKDANLSEATAKIFNGAFMNAGQICMAVKRVYVPEQMYEPVLEAFATLAKNHRVGEGFEAGVQMGPLQNKMQFDKVMDVLEDAKRQPGVRVIAGGHKLNRPGYFIEPTIIADIADDTRLVREEQFGPVLPVLKYTDLDDAIARANDTSMGLCASVWTQDLEKGAEVAARIEAGTVWVNHHVGSEADIPFGGFKESGVGREHGVIGLQSYMEAQVISVPVPQAKAAE
ncbi:MULTISPECIES: aldehyde dehydrogenase family protein [unclassified Beijerinckia]|uniref:aldehyde dehydrogenase family protein n=1 Tax=unclassified Beijerinckia TaxID=2638183 RepID=UPI000899434A|nr:MULTISPECIES: aldehyde dehydrogenase family protein [unclassified Beijerinckia]MDH7797532.1 acyl-CoA reductase-like NAD-dependent aldehyde dehydrogenase [Beijerinckia sp. GAS462]SEC89414.1 Acyl-CoA reductase [Beijerinckia sp. 28-YEA-48]